jgi:hypothetical protein
MTRENLKDIYSRYQAQITAISSLPGMKFRKLARIVAWFYGGSEESWRKILAGRARTTKMPVEVRELLSQFTRRK